MKTIPCAISGGLILATLLIAGSSAEAAETAEKNEQKTSPERPAPLGPEDDFNRGVPRTSVKGFLDAADKNDWDRAAEYLDLRRLPRGFEPREGAELAREFSAVLDRLLWIHPETLSADPKGHADDGLAAYRDFVGRIETPDRQIDILLQRVPRGDGVSIWKFSTSTVLEVPPLYELYGTSGLGDQLAEIVPPGRFFGLPLWEWVGLLLTLSAAFLSAWLIVWILNVLLRLAHSAALVSLVDRIRGPFRLLLFCLLIRSTVELIGPTMALRVVLEARTLLLVALAWLAMRVGDVMIERATARLQERGELSSDLWGRPARSFVRVLVVIFTLVLWLDLIGVRVTALLAGLGIGGVAVALAAQRPLEDLIGAITTFSTQTVRVGDFCRFGANVGTVEEIGMRTTRVRTLADTVVSVPSAEFSKLHVDNYAQRRKIRFHPTLHLRYETTPDQIRCILVEVREILYAHPRVDPDPARVRFLGFGEWSLDLEVHAYIQTTEWGEYLEIAEDLNLRIMDVVLGAGTRFAFPSQTTYLEPGAGLDEDSSREAEARVRERRARRELYLPSFPTEAVDRLQGSLPYPPEGSPSAKYPDQT